MKKLLSVLFLLASPLVWGQGSSFQSQAIGKGAQGFLVPLPGASIQVCTTSSCTSNVALCTDTTLTTCGTSSPYNPVAADASGNYSFYAAPGTYFCKVTATGFNSVTLLCSVPTAPGLDLVSNQTVGGNKTFSGNTAFTGTSSLSNTGNFTNTQMNQYLISNLNGLNFQTQFQNAEGLGHYATEAGSFGINGTAGTVFQQNVIGSYGVNIAPGSAGMFGIYAQSWCQASGTKCWGAQSIALDQTGETGNALIGYEADVDPFNLNATYTNIAGVFSVLNGSSASGLYGTAGNAGGAFVAASAVSPTAQWGQGFISRDNAANQAFVAGAACTTGTCASQPITFRSFNSNASVTTQILTTSTGQVNVNSPANTGILVNQLSIQPGANATTIVAPNPASARTYTIPDFGSNDSFVGVAATQTLTNKSTSAGPLAGTVASGTATMTTAAIAAGACGSTVTVAATGVTTSDAIAHSFNASVGANPGVLIVQSWPTANNVNFVYCNPTAGSVTPSAATLNWRVAR